MAIQELSKEEIEAVAVGLVLLGLNLGQLLNALLTPIVGIVANALNLVANIITGVGNMVSNLIVSVGQVLVNLTAPPAPPPAV
jgi:hypothetical protein